MTSAFQLFVVTSKSEEACSCLKPAPPMASKGVSWGGGSSCPRNIPKDTCRQPNMKERIIIELWLIDLLLVYRYKVTILVNILKKLLWLILVRFTRFCFSQRRTGDLFWGMVHYKGSLNSVIFGCYKAIRRPRYRS